MRAKSPQARLDSFIAKYTPEIGAMAHEALDKMRSICVGANEMVYDNYNWLVIGFVPNDRPSDAIFSLVLTPKWITLCFLQGAKLPDPKKLLRGSGKIVRSIRLLGGPDDLDKLDIRKLIDAALACAKVPLDPANKGKLVIKSVSAKQRSRRPA